jgi:hypothetical protein
MCVSLCQQDGNYPSCRAGFAVSHQFVSCCQSPANGPPTKRFQVRHLVDRVVGSVGWDGLLRANKCFRTVPPFPCLPALVTHVCYIRRQLRNVCFGMSSLYHATKCLPVLSVLIYHLHIMQQNAYPFCQNFVSFKFLSSDAVSWSLIVCPSACVSISLSACNVS